MMGNLVLVELKKLMSSKMLWMIPAGAMLPPIITALTLLDADGVDWTGYIHASMDTFNTLVFLIFASFTSFIWAREYEERMMEITLLYPYPKHKLFIAKLNTMAIIITVTVLLWVVSTCSIGGFLLNTRIESKAVIDFLKVLVPMIVMHFLLIPVTFFVTIVCKNVLVGAILGVIEVSLYYILQSGTIIQYIPLCLPMVISHHLYGFKQIILDSYIISWSILIFTFIVSFVASIIYLSKKWELR